MDFLARDLELCSPQSDTTFMTTSALVHGALPHAASILVFILACRAYLKQRSFGFLLLVFGFGIAALLAGSSLVTVCGGPSLAAEAAQVPGFWIATTYGPSVCFLLGFLLLGKGGGSSAKGKSKGASDK